MKSDTFSTVSPSIFHEVMGPDAMIFDRIWPKIGWKRCGVKDNSGFCAQGPGMKDQEKLEVRRINVLLNN